MVLCHKSTHDTILEFAHCYYYRLMRNYTCDQIIKGNCQTDTERGYEYIMILLDLYINHLMF